MARGLKVPAHLVPVTTERKSPVRSDRTHGMNDEFVEELLSKVSKLQSAGISNATILGVLGDVKFNIPKPKKPRA